jgi:hypothetical protein
MKCEAIYCFDTASVRFVVHPQGSGGPRVLAEISEDALRDLFGATGGGESLLQACDRYFEVIQSKALERLHEMPDAQVQLETSDFSISAEYTPTATPAC